MQLVYYQPQGKVMFSEEVILATRWGGGERPPRERPPLEGDPPMGETPRYWHLVAATAAVGMHPTEMHSCHLDAKIAVTIAPCEQPFKGNLVVEYYVQKTLLRKSCSI